MKSWFVQQLQQSTVLQRMMISFQARSARERLLILVLVSVFVLVIVFYTIIEPSQVVHQQAITRLSNAQNQYQRLVMGADVLAQARPEQVLEDRDTNVLRNVLTHKQQTKGGLWRIGYRWKEMGAFRCGRRACHLRLCQHGSKRCVSSA